MSKASEYAERVKAADNRPQYNVDIYVNRDGQLRINQTGTYTVSSALALAAWIVETFGDERQASGLRMFLGATLGEILRSGRDYGGGSLREVANKTGVSNSSICQIETGYIADPSFSTVAKLARLYGIDLNELVKKLGFPEEKGG
jgi:DNA-binding XRE family transcriptional regulator